ncbi:MAG: hypothetical protein RLZZ330_882 [Actinomycetota bacterium]
MRFAALPIASIIFSLTYVLNDTARPEKQLQGLGWLYLSSVLVFAYSAVYTFSKVNVEIRDEGFFITYGSFRFPKQKIDWNKVASVQAIYVEPTQWGGWGFRWVPWKRATAAVMRRGPGLRFDFANNKVFVITVDDANGALEAIRSVMDRMPPN